MVRNVMVFGDKLCLAVDPGGTTGWLLFQPVVDTDIPGGIGIQPLEWGEDREHVSFLNRVWSMVTQPHPGTRRGLDLIVIENWYPREGHRTWEPEATEIIGATRWMMGGAETAFFVQEVAHAKSHGTPAKIDKYRGGPKPCDVGRGGEGHAVMALRHAVLWSQTRWMPEAPA
jgi:hypothetical protein